MLYTKVGDFCGEFGGFVSLLAWYRCCLACIKTTPETHVETLRLAQHDLYLANAQIRPLKTFRTFSGRYRTKGSIYLTPLPIVSLHHIAGFESTSG
jgi:hypothetical protein